jgi:hypothetical protein
MPSSIVTATPLQNPNTPFVDVKKPSSASWYLLVLKKLAEDKSEEEESPTKKQKCTNSFLPEVFHIQGIERLIVSYALDTCIQVPEKFKLTKTCMLPAEKRVMFAIDTTMKYTLCKGLIGRTMFANQNNIRLVVNRDVEGDFCFDLEGIDFKDVMAMAAAFQDAQNWSQFGWEGFLYRFPTLREQIIAFYVCGFYCMMDLVNKCGADPRFEKLFPYAVVAYLSRKPEIIRTLPTSVCREIKARLSCVAFHKFKEVYIKSPAQEAHPLFA